MKTKLLIATCLALSFHGFAPPALAQTATVEFASPTYTSNELRGWPTTISLVRSAAGAGPNGYASVVVYVSGGTAASGVDYAPLFQSPYQIDFWDASTNASVEIITFADQVTEPDETIVLSLASPRGATLGKQTNATVTIVNGGPAISFADHAYWGYSDSTFGQTVSENEKFAIITVHSLSDTNLPFSVDYATKDGTAKAGIDYTAMTGTLAFALGETEKTITISLSGDDGAVSADKSFSLHLTNTTGGASILTGEAIVFIQDNEVPANLDYGFQPVVQGFNSDWDGRIYDVAPLTNGQVLIAGRFTRVNGAERFGLACLNVDGSLAQTFQTRLSQQEQDAPSVQQVTVAPDDKVYITGYFDSVNGVKRPGFARLLPDGSLDVNFAPTISLFSWPGIVAQSGGGVIGNTDSGVLRLSDTGSIDTNFVPPVVSYWDVTALAGQTDGKLLVSNSDGLIVRLHHNGSRDDSFEKVSFEGGAATAIFVQTDQKILVAGYFISANGVPRKGLARLNTDGSLDSSFDPGAVIPDYNFRAITGEENGKILLLGWNIGRRLNADGSLDSSFPGFHYGHLDEDVDLCCSNRGIKAAGAIAYVWGYFSAINGSRVYGLGRIFLDGPQRTGMDIQSASTHDPGGSYSGADYLQAVGERDGVLRVKVRRLGETIGPASVTFGTRDRTAIAGRHYVSTTATLSFAPLEQEKIVTVPILHNATYDGPKTLELFLTNVVGAAFLGPPLIMTIFDEEPGFAPGAITRLADGTTQISVRVLPPTSFRLQASSDLKTWITLWDDWGAFGGSQFKQTFYDSDATKLPQRFYRVRAE